MKFFSKDPLPETKASLEIGASIDALNKEISRDTSGRAKMASLASSFLTGALSLGFIVILTPIKIPLLAFGAIAALAGYGITKMLKTGYEQDIARKAEMVANLEIEREAARRIKLAPEKKPAVPKPAVKQDYNTAAGPAPDPANDAGRIAALEQRLRELKGTLNGTADLDKPKSIQSRTGFGA